MGGQAWLTARVPREVDVLAPDGSEIRVLVGVAAGSLVHCRLLPGQTTVAVRHRTVEEVWYCIAGRGQVWRRADIAIDDCERRGAEQPEGSEEIVDLEPGVALTIPLGTAFQFRATGAEPLELVLTTMPPWPGPDEAVPTAGVWPPTV